MKCWDAPEFALVKVRQDEKRLGTEVYEKECNSFIPFVENKFATCANSPYPCDATTQVWKWPVFDQFHIHESFWWLVVWYEEGQPRRPSIATVAMILRQMFYTRDDSTSHKG